ncbi:MAG: aminopeptidase N [Bacteroidetes bacterium]|nr:MAG: aminopeptidase N [Bacteroidota bacterium]
MKKILLFACIPVLLGSCSIFGIHYKVHNPKRAGKYPEKTEQLRLLGGHSKYRDGFDVKQYALDIRIDPAKQYVGGLVRMDAVALRDLDTIQIDLYPEMKMLLVQNGKTSCPFFRGEGAVFIVPGPVKKGERFSLLFVYEGNPMIAKRPPWVGGAVWKYDYNGNPWCGIACESEGASLWWPCKDMMDDEPDTVQVNLTVPAGLVAVSNGRLQGSEEKGELTTWKWLVSYPINVYNVTYYVGKFKRVHDSYESEVTGQTLDLDHYVLDYNYERALKHFRQVKDHIALYEKRFGPYPWYRDGFKLVESPFAGMEHQTGIAYGNGYTNDYEGFDYIILHETAHEWWGNSVTAADLGDGWIHEGFATYAEALFVEETQGRDAYRRYLLDQRLTIINRRPVSRPFNMRYFNYRDGDIYHKGSWILHSLRYALENDSLFFDILETFATENAPKTVTSKDFIALVNRKTGKDYQWFFDQYLYNRLAPEIEYSIEKGKMYYRWTSRTMPGFKMKQRVSGTAGASLIEPAHKTIRELDIPASSLPYVSLNGNDYLVRIVRVKHLRREFMKQKAKGG